MNSRNHKYALLLVAAVAVSAAGAMSQAFAQQVTDGMDGYVKGTSGIYTGNPNECWYDDGEGNMMPCRIDTGDYSMGPICNITSIVHDSWCCLLLRRIGKIKERS